jgi:erythromycin esterase
MKIILRYLVIAVFLVSSPFNGFTQQPLNLDFEQSSAEGFVRPWGWELNNYSSAEVKMDSLSVYHGGYSLSIQDVNQKADQTLSYDIEPYQLNNSTVRIEGWCKTDALHGAAFFTIRLAQQGRSVVTDTSNQIISGTSTWQKLSIELHTPSNLDYISLHLHHSGKGTSWFDHFTLRKDGKLLKEVEVSAPIEKKELSWLRKNAYPLDYVGPGKPTNDLAAFKNFTADAQIIALGESTHGTSEFFRLKHRLLEYAVKELGIRVFAIEDNQLVIERANKYVMGGKGSARSSMNGMFSVWQNREVHDLIQWMRSYNDEHPEDKVSFMGFDIQQLNLPLDSLFAYLERQSPSLLQEASSRLEALKNNVNNYYTLSDNEKLKAWKNATTVYNLVKKHSADWFNESNNKADSMQIIWGEQYALLVKQYTENIYKGHQSLYRDEAMAENIRWIHEKYAPNKRIIVWAHDLHISLGTHPEDSLNYYSGKSMGAQLRKHYGQQYKAYGLWSYTGTYWAQKSYSDFQQMECPLFTAPKGTLESALHDILPQMDTPFLLLDLRKAKGKGWLSTPLPVRFANHVSIDYGFWVRIAIPYQFDGIFFIDRTTAAKSYAR